MSGGPSALGTLLVQRLDAVLGTTLAQQASLISGARSDAVAQTAPLARIHASQDSTHTDLRHSVERVARHTGSRATVRSSPLNTAAKTDKRPTAGVPPTSSASTQLGHAARVILALLAQYPDPAPSASARQPLWQPAEPLGPTATSPAAPPVATLARALGQALAYSGMFYESHLADLAFGKRLPEQLFGEPQAQLVGGDENAHTVAQPGSDASLLVRQQLEVLAYQMFRWQGQAWPDAPMDWEIRRHDDSGADPDQTWTSRLRLQLSQLGDVHVKLSLVGDTLTLRMYAPNCADLLRTQSSALRARYQAQGLTLSQLAIDDASADWADWPDTASTAFDEGQDGKDHES